MITRKLLLTLGAFTALISTLNAAVQKDSPAQSCSAIAQKCTQVTLVCCPLVSAECAACPGTSCCNIDCSDVVATAKECLVAEGCNDTECCIICCTENCPLLAAAKATLKKQTIQSPPRTSRSLKLVASPKLREQLGIGSDQPAVVLPTRTVRTAVASR